MNARSVVSGASVRVQLATALLALAAEWAREGDTAWADFVHGVGSLILSGRSHDETREQFNSLCRAFRAATQPKRRTRGVRA